MRFSRYNITTRKLNTGDYVLLNGLTGTLDIIDEEVYDVISSHSSDEALGPDVLKFIAPLSAHLLERGYITELSSSEELAKAKETALKLVEKSENPAWDVVLIPNLGCNYRCTYCFEKGTGYPSITMSKEQVDAIFAIIKDHVTPGEESLTLYGGEPLAKENRELIEYIIEKGCSSGHSFFAVTNGHDLEHYMDLLGNGKINSVQITMDGPKHIHDKRRITLDKSSSYDRILSNIETALRETDVSVKLRMNVDKRNAPFIMDLLDDLDRRGIINNPALLITANPVVGIGELGLTPKDIRALETAVEAKYPQFHEMFMGRTMVSNDKILPALYFGLPVPLRASVCSASDGMKVFSPDGNIYSCWSAIGMPEHIIGTYDESGKVSWDNKVLDNWKKTMIAFNKECLGCKYAFLCAGGCHRPAINKESAASVYDCDYYHNLFEDYLARVTESYLATVDE